MSVNGGPVACFSGVITPEDEEVLQVTRGDIKGQQSFEGLALLVAVRLWLNLWCARRVRLILRSDNVGVMFIYSAVKGRGEGMNLIAREYALDIRECSYEPDVIDDIPSITNIIADLLSRRTDPVYLKNESLPQFLSNAKHIAPQTRPPSWWRYLSIPGFATRQKFGGWDQS